MKVVNRNMPCTRKYFLVLLVALTGGCASTPPDQIDPAEQIFDGQWSDEQKDLFSPTDEQAATAIAWWTIFDDPVLSELIITSYQQSLDLRIAGLKIYEARSLLGIQQGGLYPSIDAVTTFQKDNASEHDTAIPINTDRYTSGLDLSWEIDLWGKNRSTINATYQRLLAQVASYDAFLVSLLSEVAHTYVRYRSLQERLQFAYQGIELQQRSLEIAQVWFSNGGKTELDVQQAKALLNDTRGLVPSLRRQLRQTENALTVLTSIPLSKVRTILQKGPAILPTVKGGLSLQWPINALRRRPDIRALEYLSLAEAEDIGIAKKELYPTFSLAGLFGFAALHGAPTLAGGIGGSTASDLFSSDAASSSVALGFRFPILNFGRLKNNIRAQDAQLQQALESYQNAILQAAREVEDASVGYIYSKQQQQHLETSVTAYHRALEISKNQYEDGAINFQPVLDSLRSLLYQEQNLVETKTNVIRNLITAFKAVGGGWELRTSEGFLPGDTLEKMNNRVKRGTDEMIDDLEKTRP